MSAYDDLLLALAIIGAFYVVRILFCWICEFYRYCIRCGKNLVNVYGTNNNSSKPWAAITGPTGALGFDYCREFAKQGFNILFIARNETKAQDKISKLEKEYPSIKTHFIQCDLGNLVNNEESINSLQTSFQTFIDNNNDISVLINNAGVEFDSDRWGDISLNNNILLMKVNMFAVIIITQLLLPYFEERNKNGLKSLIVTVGSTLERVIMPGVNIYGATKRFLNYWSIASSKEYEKYNIDFIIINPGSMVSDMTKMEKNKLFGIITTEEYVKNSTKFFGHWRARETIGHWIHGLMIWQLQLMPMEIGLFVRQSILLPFFNSLRKE